MNSEDPNGLGVGGGQVSVRFAPALCPSRTPPAEARMMIEKRPKSTPSTDKALDVAKVVEGALKRSDAPVVPSRQTRWPPAEDPATPILAGADRGRAVMDPGGPSW